jgi:hypothetical protein
LKRLIVNGTDDPMWSAHLAVDRPAFLADTLDVAGAVRKALETAPTCSSAQDD